jgi:putative transposase
MIKPYRDCFNASVAEKLGWFKSATWDGELKFQARMSLKALLEGAMEEERTHQLQAARHQRTPARRDQRNGYTPRDLQTEHGLLRGLQVPRSRLNLYEPQVFGRYERRTAAVDQAIVGMFLAGVSTRRVGEVLEGLVGAGVSATTVSRVTREIEQLVRAYHHRPLTDHYRYLLLDGIWLGCKSATGRRKVVVLTAYGITWDGRRELIDFRVADSESEANWSAFLNDLYRRGLVGEHLQLVTTDGAPGLLAALDLVYPHVPRQRCWFHKLQNVSTRLRVKHRAECLAQARQIYLASTRREALQRFREWQAHWEPLEPKAVACLTQDLEALLTCFAFPAAHRPTIRTTNPIERSFREVRRRTNPMSCFTNPANIDRIVFAVMHDLNHRWGKTPLRHFT